MRGGGRREKQANTERDGQEDSHREREREKGQNQRQTDREGERQTDRETQTDRQTEAGRQSERRGQRELESIILQGCKGRERYRQTDRQGGREGGRERQREIIIIKDFPLRKRSLWYYYPEACRGIRRRCVRRWPTLHHRVSVTPAGYRHTWPVTQ